MYDAILSLADEGKAIDPFTVGDKTGDPAYCTQLANSTPSASNVTNYAEIVRECATERLLHQTGASLQNLEGPISERLERAEQLVSALLTQSDPEGPQAVMPVLKAFYQDLEARYEAEGQLSGKSTGLTLFDRYTGGLEAGCLYIIGARPGMGKTALALNIATAVAEQGPVLFASLEMPAAQLMRRIASSGSGISSERFKYPKRMDNDDWPKLSMWMSAARDLPLHIDETPALELAKLRSRARRLSNHGGLSLVVVDYLQLMRGPKETRGFREQEIGAISRGLKQLAKELRVPVVALCQLNRALENREDKRPRLSDLRESGSIEQDADVVTFLYRDEVYHPETNAKGIAELIFQKVRDGATGKGFLEFRGDLAKFSDYYGSDPVYAQPKKRMAVI